MISIFTYGFDAAKMAFAKAGVPFSSLTDYQHLISLAVDKGLVTEKEQGILLKWREDPAGWTGV